MADDWISISEASKQSGYSAEHLRDLMREGRIKARKFVTVWQVNRSSLLAYHREQQSKGEKRGRKSI